MLCAAHAAHTVTFLTRRRGGPLSAQTTFAKRTNCALRGPPRPLSEHCGTPTREQKRRWQERRSVGAASAAMLFFFCSVGATVFFSSLSSGLGSPPGSITDHCIGSRDQVPHAGND